MTGHANRDRAAVRVEFLDVNAHSGKVWLRDPANADRWIDVSHYVTAVRFDADFNDHNRAQVTFIRAATGAP